MVAYGAVDPYWGRCCNGDVDLYWRHCGRDRRFRSTGDGVVEYGAVDLYWGSCGRECHCRQSGRV